METIETRKRDTNEDIHPLFKKRWSPRAFVDDKILQKNLEEIFTAASWAASAMNEQPWHYVYAVNGTSGFIKLWSSLLPGNQPWTKNAPVIFAAFYRKDYRNNGKPNRAAMHDLGMANAHLLLEAASKGIYGHLIGGFDANKLSQSLDLDPNLVPMVMGVLGYPGNPEQLDEPYRSRETMPRTRLPLEEFVQEV